MEENLQYAIIQAGGRQYNVSVGQRIRINQIAEEVEKGSEYVINDVLAIGNGTDNIAIGTPFVEGAAVNCKIIGNCRGKKVIAFKRRRRKGYRRKVGHRQDYTELLIENIKIG